MTSKVATPRKRGRPAKAQGKAIPQKEEATLVSEESTPEILEPSLTSKVATPGKRGRPAKAEATPVKPKASVAIPSKAQEKAIPQKKEVTLVSEESSLEILESSSTSKVATPRKRGRPSKAQEKSIPQNEEVTLVSEESAPKTLESVDLKKRKPTTKTPTKVKPSVTESDNSETEQASVDSDTNSEETIQALTPTKTVSKKLKAGNNEKALSSKEKNPAETISIKEAKSKSETSSHKNTLKPNSTPASTLENGRAHRKKGSIKFDLEPLPTIKDIAKWASKYKEGLSIQEQSFSSQQISLSNKVQAKLLKQGLSAPQKKILESLDDSLFGNNRQVVFENGLDVSTLWLVTSWRYLRGTFKPSVLALVKSNEDIKVQKATKEIFYSVKNALNGFQKAKKADDVFCIKHKEEIGTWVSSLSTISGLSAVTATAILAMFTDEIPYMSEEGLLASLGTNKGSHEDGTLTAYLEYVGSAVKEFGGKLKPKEIESGWYYHSFEL